MVSYLKNLFGWINDFTSLVFPRICPGCGNNLWKHEKVICNSCEFHLPKTNFHLTPENPVSDLFIGRADIIHGTAFLYFNKGGRVQQMIHCLKYKGRTDVGIFLGSLYGQSLVSAEPFKNSNMIIPVPLHKQKQLKRGYNQSEQFGIGLSEQMKIPVINNILTRRVSNETQTRKSRYDRYNNVHDIFEIRNPEALTGMQVLLVDDVITTGATLEACITTLRKIPGVRVAVACIAVASC